MKKRRKIFFITVINLILVSFCMLGCSKKANKYSESEHIQRISNRIEKKFITENSIYTSFSVYPLYSQNDELDYFVVEFEPCGFVYVKLREEEPHIFSFFGFRTSMYSLSSLESEHSWSKYVFDESNDQPLYELDENEERIYYTNSPYRVANMEDNRMYLLSDDNNSNSCFVPAIKVNDKYLNLISMKEFSIEDGVLCDEQPNVYITFIANPVFDL